MGNNMKRGIFIDFFGMPGSGKTTIAHNLAINLRYGRYQVVEPTFLTDTVYSTPLRLLYKVLCSIKFTLFHPVYLYQLFSMLEKGAFLGVGEAVKQWINICFTLVSLNKGLDKDYVISDEGIIQAAISLTVRCSEENTKEIIYKLTQAVNRPIIFAYVKADVDVVLERLAKRKNGKSRIDAETDLNKRRQKLTEIEKKCNIAEESVDIIEINNSEASITANLVAIISGELEKR